MIEDSPIRVVGMTREDSAGFAADAYARLHGLGCVCVTYCVGGLSLCNSIAGAYAEKSPVIVLGGSPGLGERAQEPAAAPQGQGVRDAVRGVREDHRGVDGARRPADGVRRDRPGARGGACGTSGRSTSRSPATRCWSSPRAAHRPPAGLPPSDPEALREAVDEAAAMLTAAKRPMILADVEVHRFGLQDDLIALAESTGMPVATTILGKSVDLRVAPAVRRRLRGGDGPRRGHRVRRGGRLPADARLLPHRHQPRHLHRQARPVAVHQRDERGPADPPPPLQRRPARRLHPRAGRAPAQGGEDPGPAPARPAEPPLGRRARRAGDLGPAVRPAQPDARREDGGDRRHRRLALRRRRPVDEPADRVHRPGLLHVDGVRRPGGGRRRDGQPVDRGRW